MEIAIFGVLAFAGFEIFLIIVTEISRYVISARFRRIYRKEGLKITRPQPVTIQEVEARQAAWFREAFRKLAGSDK